MVKNVIFIVKLGSFLFGTEQTTLFPYQHDYNHMININTMY